MLRSALHFRRGALLIRGPWNRVLAAVFCSVLDRDAQYGAGSHQHAFDRSSSCMAGTYHRIDARGVVHAPFLW